jgi:hypothetical protein
VKTPTIEKGKADAELSVDGKVVTLRFVCATKADAFALSVYLCQKLGIEPGPLAR